MKNSTFRITIIAFLITLVASNFSFSQSKEKRDILLKIEDVFKKRDKNNDGKLEKGELIGLVSNDFTKLDTDEDGFISKEELEKAPKPKKKRAKTASIVFKRKFFLSISSKII